MDDDVKQILMNHESRLTRLETEVKNMNGWMKGIDKKLDKLLEEVSYMRGRENNAKMDKKMYWSILFALVTNLGLLVAILSKVL